MLTDSRPYRPWLTWSPDGGNLLVVTGDDREPWDCKTLTLCRPLTGSCRALPQPPSTVSLDPAWSRDGTQIAFVRAPARGTPGAGGDLGSWYPSRRLWMADAAGSGAHEVPGAGEGVSAPRWGTGGSTVRFSTASAIRSIPAAGGTPETLAGSLTGGDDAEWAAAGKQPWAGVAVWASAP